MKDLGSDMLRINSTLAVAQFLAKGRLIKFLTRCHNENSINLWNLRRPNVN